MAIGNITSTPSYAAVNSPGASVGTSSSSVGLDSQLAQCETQLSDWVNCSSAKTPEGKAKIEELSGKIVEIKKSMEKADSVRLNNQSTVVNISTAAITQGLNSAAIDKEHIMVSSITSGSGAAQSVQHLTHPQFDSVNRQAIQTDLERKKQADQALSLQNAQAKSTPPTINTQGQTTGAIINTTA